jgi:alpha/beta superfamily hydrolase
MREYPVFIPRGDEHLSAVITIPDADPRGVVLLQPGGGGAPHSHRTAMYTKIARGLAARGIASVRLDWKGVGDSTGTVAYSFKALPVGDAVAVGRFAMDALGTHVFGMAGNCGGARIALGSIPQIPETRSAVLIMVKPLAGPATNRDNLRRTKLVLKQMRHVGPVARKAYWAARWRKAGHVLESIRAVSGMSDVLLLEANTMKAGKLLSFVHGLQRSNGHQRLEIEELPGGSTRGFHSLERQAVVISRTVDWFDQTFPGNPPRPAEAPRPLGQAARR